MKNQQFKQSKSLEKASFPEDQTYLGLHPTLNLRKNLKYFLLLTFASLIFENGVYYKRILTNVKGLWNEVFSKKGLTSVRTVIQKDSIDDALRNKLWNVVNISVWDRYQSTGIRSYTRSSNIGPLFCILWNDFFGQPIDTIPQYFNEAVSFVRKSYFNFQWFEVYDFIEFIAQNSPRFLDPNRFCTLCNSVLEEEKSAYRFLKSQLIEMTSDVELEAVEAAIETGARFPGVEAHLRTAIKHLSDRKKPDFRNCIKESISAVESLCKAVSGDPKATLNKALAVLEGKRKLHARLKTSFSALYEYSSDADGIRHAMLEEPKLSFVDAKYMLVVCSGFINYVTGKLSETEV